MKRTTRWLFAGLLGAGVLLALSCPNPLQDRIAQDVEQAGNSVPEIDVRDPGGTPIPSGTGSYTFTGEVLLGSTADAVIEIANTGTADLTLTGSKVTIGGAGASQFSLITASLASVVTPTVPTQFTLRFAPNSVGVKTATVSIWSTDADENPYTFLVTGTAASKPEIHLQQSATDIPSGTGSYDFGYVSVGSPREVVFTLHNLGNETLNLDGSPDRVQVTGAAQFVVSQQPSATVAAGDSTSFKISFTPSSLGTKTASVSIPSNDADEDPYTFALSGSGSTNPTVTISSLVVSPSNLASIPLTIEFSETVSGFTQGDITVTNGSASGFNGAANPSFSVTVSPVSDGLVTVNVPAATANATAGGAPSEAAVPWSLLSDRTAPSGSVVIAGGATYANTQNVTLSLSSADGSGSGVAEMLLSNDGGFSGASWESYSSTRAWTLLSGDGTKYVYLRLKDAAGNVSSIFSDSISLDTSAPAAPSGLDLAAADDTGTSSTDDITKLATGLSISGSAEANASVELFDSAVSKGSATASGAGAWSLDISLAEGSHPITAKASDAAGNVSGASSILTIVVDTSITVPAGLDLASADDTGTSDTDNLTKLASGLTIAGSAEANATVELFDAAVSKGSTTASGAGAWSLDISLAEGSHPITAKASDAAGNVSGASSALSIVVDATAPGIPSILKPMQGANTGTNLRPTFTWTAQSGATYDFQLDDSSASFPSPEVNLSGTSSTSYTPPSNLSVSGSVPKGTRYYTRSRAVDAAGNASSWSDRYVNVGRFDNDFNGDGYADVLVGASAYETAMTGKAYIFYGSASMSSSISVSSASVALTGAATNDYFGQSVASAGDVNGDGFADAIVGAPMNDAGGTDGGRAYIFYGSSTLTGSIAASSANVTLTGAAAGDQFGTSVASAGDVNGDGYADVISGAPYNAAGGVGAGRAYLFYGSASMAGSIPASSANVTLTGGTAGDIFSLSVSSAGDVNGDGCADLFAGAPGNNANGINAGRAYLFYGSASMAGSISASSANVTLTGAASTNDYFGFSVASAGDVNGDGYADLISGAYWNDAGGTNAGRAYIYYGSASMASSIPASSANVILTGGAADDEFGISVASARDVNGDGYADVIVGADKSDASASNTGRAYLFFGSSSMASSIPASSANVTIAGAAVEDWFGYSVASAGDVNGDGYADVISGAIFNDAGANQAGRAYLFYGSTSMSNSMTASGANVKLTGATEYEVLGISVASTGNGTLQLDAVLASSLLIRKGKPTFNRDVLGSLRGSHSRCPIIRRRMLV